MFQGKKDEEPVWTVQNVLKRFAWGYFKGNENYKKIFDPSQMVVRANRGESTV